MTSGPSELCLNRGCARARWLVILAPLVAGTAPPPALTIPVRPTTEKTRKLSSPNCVGLKRQTLFDSTYKLLMQSVVKQHGVFPCCFGLNWTHPKSGLVSTDASEQSPSSTWYQPKVEFAELGQSELVSVLYALSA